MTQKHFKAICTVLKYHKNSLPPHIFRELVADLVRTFSEFNPRFKIELFVEACGESLEKNNVR